MARAGPIGSGLPNRAGSLVICRTLAEIFSRLLLAKALTFRDGTAL
jgi:hypothetical protein